jgi:hypothetical protein
MTTQHDKAKRWRPRFSVRTLAIVVTLVCVYLACWHATKTRGVDDVARHVAVMGAQKCEKYGVDGDALSELQRVDAFGATANVPFIVDVPPVLLLYDRCYYFWFFGYVAKLPWSGS